MILFALALAAAQSGCAAPDSHLPPDLSGWARAGTTLDTGHSVMLTGRGGLAEMRVTIRKAGTFGIAADQPAWIDVYRGPGKALVMASESHGPRCSTIVKIVRYRLDPGTYRVVVTKMTGDRVKLMLVHGSYSPAYRPGYGSGSRAPYRPGHGSTAHAAYRPRYR